MTDSNDVKALEKISTEVDESQLKIILSIQCIKAQSFLVSKLHKQTEQQKQICNFISNGNLKLETEIRLAEQEVKSLLVAHETIKSANVELRKELLLAKERTMATTERVNNGIKKYEELWITSKQRYENIPFIQKYLQTINKKDTLHNNITKLANEKQKLLSDINKKKHELLCLDRKNIIELARYMIYERPVTLKNIKNKQDELNKLLKDIQETTNSNDNITTLKVDLTVDKNASIAIKNMSDSWHSISKTENDTITMPKLQLRGIDLDFFSHKLDQIKKIDSQKITIKRVDSEPLINQPKKIKTDEMIKDVYVSTYFSIKNEDSVDLNSNYSDKKLIHILEDIKLDKAEAYEIVAKVNCSALQNVNKIGENVQQEKKNNSQEQLQNIKEQEEDVVKIEEIDLTTTQACNVLMPPSQFLDFSQNESIKISQGHLDAEKNNTKNSQEKKVILDEVKDTNIDLDKPVEEDENNKFDISATSDDSYKKIKEIVFKKHNLDLSPQFTYTKNSVTSVKSENVTSKFFDLPITDENNKIQSMDIDEKPTNVNEVESSQIISNDEVAPETINENKNDGEKDTMAGFLFAHGPQGIVDSLDVSVSTLGYDDSDMPPCIDSSLLLSPKADDQIPSTSGNVQVSSQEVPNFLSGLKKTGLSFFGNQQSDDKSAIQNQNSNFTFAFGGDGKKSRGGFFSMFH